MTWLYELSCYTFIKNALKHSKMIEYECMTFLNENKWKSCEDKRTKLIALLHLQCINNPPLCLWFVNKTLTFEVIS